MLKVHLIDDDEKLHKLLKVYFENNGIELSSSFTPEQGLEYIKYNLIDLVILDLMLPNMDGFSTLKKIREYNNDLPIIILSAKGDNLSKIQGLELGSDDYISKPFEPKELLIRIRNIIKRVNKNRPDILYNKTFNIEMNLSSREVKVNNNLVELTETEFDLLKIFIENAGIVQTRDSLMDKLRGIEFDSFDRAIDVHISRLRQKLNDKKGKIIKTVWGVGYIMPK